MKRYVVATAICGLLLAAGWWSWKKFSQNESAPAQGSASAASSRAAADEGTENPNEPENLSRAAIRRPTLATLAADRRTAMAELPEGELRRGLAALPETVRAEALARLAELRVPFNDHAALRVDLGGNFYYVCAVPPGVATQARAALSEPGTLESTQAATAAGETAAAAVPISQPPVRHSRPGAARVAYLDFNGHTVTGTAWNTRYSVTTFATRAYDTDGSPTTFSDAEQAAILRIWARVAEDFAPFEIDVTTEEPAVFTSQTARILITRSTDANGVTNPEGGGAGGVAFLDVFGRDNYSALSPAFVYYNNLGNDANVAEAASHELGHNLALAHDGTTTLAYYGGHGAGETSWGPIMGTGYGRNVSQWSKGEYFKANNTQDDLAILAARLTYRADDAGDTRSTAQPLAFDGAVVSASGLIERPTDADRFAFTTVGGSVTLTVKPSRVESGTLGGNLDVKLELYDAADALVASANPTGTLAAAISTSLPPGDYTLRVSAVGVGDPRVDPPSGYTAYGSAGSYTITGTVPPLTTPVAPTIVTPPLASTVVAGGTASFSVTATGSAPLSYQWKKGETNLPGQTLRTLTLPAAQVSDEGFYAVVVTNPVGSVTSGPVALTVVPAPVAPGIVTPPASQAVTTGAAVTFSVSASGTAPLSYQWRRNGVAIPGATAASLSFAAVTVSEAGNYSVVVSNQAGAATSPAAVLTVYALPVFTVQPVSRAVVPGGNAVFTVEVASLPTATLRWQRSVDEGLAWTNLTDGAGVSGANTGTLTLAAVTTASSGFRYRAVATNSVGAVVSDPAVLTVTAIASSTYHTLYLKADGSVWATGDNNNGSFGNDAPGVYATPIQIASGATAVAAGHAHSLVLKADGTLWAAGLNNFGQLGDGTFTHRPAFVQIATEVSAIAARSYGSAFVRQDGTLWVTGDNSEGQLGDGTKVMRNQPVAIATGVRSVALGYLHLLYVDSAGGLHAVGANTHGQLGDGTTTERLSAVKVATGVKQAVAGYTFSAYVRNDGTVWGMGQNHFGQLGDGTTVSRFSPVPLATQRTRVHANFNHLFTYDGATAQLFGSGGNLFGQLDQSGVNLKTSPVTVASSVAVAEAGYFMSHWVKTDGSTWAVGRNLAGQLGDGSTTDRLAPVEIFVGVPTVAGTPAGFRASDGNSAAATRLTWTHLVGAPRYEVWRHTANNVAAATRLVSDEVANFFEDRTGVAGVTYFYWVRAIGPGGAGAFSAADTGFRVAQGTPPAFVTPPQNAFVVAGNTATFTVGVSGDPVPAIQWQLSTNAGTTWTDLADNSVYQGATTATLRVSSVPANFSGYLYRAVADNTAGRTESMVVTLSVNPAPQRPEITTQPETVYANENTAATFLVNASGAGPITYQWRRNSVAISGAVSSIYTLPSVQFADAGTYDVVVTNAAGPTTSNAASLIVTSPGLLTPEKSVVSSRLQNYTVTVNTSGPWAVTESLPWITVTPMTGTGRTSFNVSVAENTGTAMRTGTISVNGVAHTVVQLAPSGLDHWVWRNPLPRGFALRRVIWDGGQFVAVGERGSLQTSPDGVTWTLRGNETIEFYGLAQGAGKYVAVGQFGRIYTSPDGVTWTERNSGVGAGLQSVTWSGSTFVAVGLSGTIITSPDGVTWTARASGKTTLLRQVTWAGGQFFAVGDAGVILQSADGATWTARTSGTTNNLFCIASSGGQWVAAGTLGVVLTSPDGVNWTIRNSGGTLFFQDMLWDGTAFVAVASQGRVLTSPDGISWTTFATGTANTLHSVAWDGQRYLAVGASGSIVASADRSMWPLVGSVGSGSVRDVVWNGRVFVAVGDSGTIVSSADGVTWVVRNTDPSRFLSGVAWSGARFVAVGEGGLILTSPDGIAWTSLSSGTSFSLNSVIWTGTRFVAVGGGHKVATSPDGLTWTIQGTGINQYLYDVTWNGELYVAVGDRGKIFTSPDALTWTERVSPATSGLMAVEWGGSMFVAVGVNGDAATSPDGITWTKLPLSSGVALYSLTWNGSKFIAMGSFGYTMVSPDGVHWVVQIVPVPSGGTIEGLAWSGDQFVAVGWNGMILQAIDPTASEAPQIELQPQPQTAPAASSVSFRAVASGTPVPRYQWFKDTAPLAGATAETLTLTNLAPADVGAYSVVATNSAGSATSNAATLTILSGYDAWALAYFAPGEATDPAGGALAADPDADGLSNLLEYALGLEPKTETTSALPHVSASGSEWVYTYTRPVARSDIVYAVEVSTALTSWTTDGVTHELVSTDAVAGTQTWRARYPMAGAANAFFRLKVTSP